MAPTTRVRRWKLTLSLLVLIGTLTVPYSVSAAEAADHGTLPDVQAFAASLVNGDGGDLVGVYAEYVFAFPVVDTAGVSKVDGTVTEFGAAEQFGVTGLLAHNRLSGRYFRQLFVGQRILLVYGDGHLEPYRVRQIRRYRATAPLSAYSDFVDLDTQQWLAGDDLFTSAYQGARHVTFQTCIAKDGISSWGRLFVIAEPEEVLSAADGELPQASVNRACKYETAPQPTASFFGGIPLPEPTKVMPLARSEAAGRPC
jgi:hypothetical protein